MANKCLIMLILVTIVSGGVFAQTDFESDAESNSGSDFASKPKNTIVVDIGPTIAGLALGSVLNTFLGEDASSSGFGIGAQYERQILEKLSIAGRFAYMGVGFGMTDSYDEGMGATVNTKLGLNLYTFSMEAHARFYPSGETFFLGGMLGFGTLSAAFSGDVVAEESSSNTKESINVSLTATRGYLKLGARIGWRINFGRVGGFTFEPSLGYDLAIGLGDTLGIALKNEVQNKTGEEINELQALDLLFFYLENFIFVGGPRLTLSFGWRF